jgi:hypothetical protein
MRGYASETCCLLCVVRASLLVALVTSRQSSIDYLDYLNKRISFTATYFYSEQLSNNNLEEQKFYYFFIPSFLTDPFPKRFFLTALSPFHRFILYLLLVDRLPTVVFFPHHLPSPSQRLSFPIISQLLSNFGLPSHRYQPEEEQRTNPPQRVFPLRLQVTSPYSNIQTSATSRPKDPISFRLTRRTLYQLCNENCKRDYRNTRRQRKE